MNNAFNWRLVIAGLPCNLTRGLMHFNAPLWLRTSGVDRHFRKGCVTA